MQYHSNPAPLLKPPNRMSNRERRAQLHAEAVAPGFGPGLKPSSAVAWQHRGGCRSPRVLLAEPVVKALGQGVKVNQPNKRLSIFRLTRRLWGQVES
jgi:hypothetical protein